MKTIHNIYESPDYVRSQRAYIAQCAFEYLASILVADVFLAKLLSHMGIGDVIIGIISSLISFSFLFQLLSVALVARISEIKKTVVFFYTLSQFLFMGIYLVPLLPVGVGTKTVIVIGCILTAYLCQYLVSSLCFKWANSYVDPHKRGEYSAVKELVSLVAGIVFTFIMGWVIDRYDELDNLQSGFLLIAGVMLVINICNFASLMLIKKDVPENSRKRNKSVREVIHYVLRNKAFVNLIILSSLWDIARYMTIGFLGTFKTSDLLLSVGAVQLINIASNVCRLFVAKPFGRYSDKTSYVQGFRVALILLAAAFAINIFTTPKYWWLIIMFQILFSVSYSGSTQNSFNMTYSYVDKEYFAQAMAIKQSVSGVLGFCASLVGGWILNGVQRMGNTFMGIPMYGQQLLSAISFTITIMAILFSKFVIEKQARLVQ